MKFFLVKFINIYFQLILQLIDLIAQVLDMSIFALKMLKGKTSPLGKA